EHARRQRILPAFSQAARSTSCKRKIQAAFVAAAVQSEHPIPLRHRWRSTRGRPSAYQIEEHRPPAIYPTFVATYDITRRRCPSLGPWWGHLNSPLGAVQGAVVALAL